MVTRATLLSQVKGLDSLPALCGVTLLGLKSEGAKLWHASSMQSLRIDEAALEVSCLLTLCMRRLYHMLLLKPSRTSISKSVSPLSALH